MAGIWIIAGISWAGVVVDDPSGCLDPDVVDLELRSIIGDARTDEVDLAVDLVTSDAEGPLLPWAMHLEIRGPRGVLWRRTLPIEEFDCPFAPALVARSAEQGLAGIPQWQLETLPPPGRPSELAFRFGITLPTPLHFDMGGRLGVGLGGPVLGLVDLDLYATGVNPVGQDKGGQFMGGMAGIGVGLDLRVRSVGSVRVAASASVGPAVVVGRQFIANDVDLVSRGIARFEVGFASSSVFRVASRLQVPVVRLALSDDGTGDTFLEPWVRVGVVVGIAGALRGPRGAGERMPTAFDADPGIESGPR